MKLSHSQIAMISQRVALADSKEIVLVDVGGHREIELSEHNSNVYCLDLEGNVFWQVSIPSSSKVHDSFVDIGFDGKALRANRFFGGEYIINLTTGEAVEVGWHK
jgi:hypothetical protein